MRQRGIAHAGHIGQTVFGKEGFRFVGQGAMDERDANAGRIEVRPGSRDIGHGLAAEGAAERTKKDDEDGGVSQLTEWRVSREV